MKDLREDIVFKFNSELNCENSLHQQLVSVCEERFNSNDHQSYRKLIGGLRKVLASVGVVYLKPDLIIMD